MKKKWGFFDVDSREVSGNSLEFRPRVQPIGDKLNWLYHFAQENAACLVFTTCCSGKMLQPGCRNDVLFIPLDSGQRTWEQDVPQYRQFYLQKRPSSPDLSCLETFTYNQNAVHLLSKLEVDEWVVFGNGWIFA